MDRALSYLEKLRKSRALNQNEPDDEYQIHENKPTEPEELPTTSTASDANPPDSVLSTQSSVLTDEPDPPTLETSTESEIASSEWIKNPQNKPTVESEIRTIDGATDHGSDQEMLS